MNKNYIILLTSENDEANWFLFSRQSLQRARKSLHDFALKRNARYLSPLVPPVLLVSFFSFQCCSEPSIFFFSIISDILCCSLALGLSYGLPTTIIASEDRRAIFVVGWFASLAMIAGWLNLFSVVTLWYRSPLLISWLYWQLAWSK